MSLTGAMRVSRGSTRRGPGAARAAQGGTRRGDPKTAPAKKAPPAPTHRLGRGDPGERRRLGDSDLRVSLACLDASTWTKCGDETQAHAQLSLAVDNGVNLVHLGSADASRQSASSSSSSATIFELTRGRADAYMGSWLRRSRDVRREDLVLAASVPFGAWVGAVDGGAKGRRRRVKDTVERMLMSLDTDHVDLLQLHFPTRDASTMDGHGGDAPNEDEVAALLDLVSDGKARFLGVDDDTRWAALETARLRKTSPQLPTSASARGEYNLLVRDGFDCVLDELLNDDGGLKGVGLVAHSPLGRKGSRLSGRAGSGKIQIRSGGSESERMITKLERQRGGSETGSPDAGRLVDAYEEVAGQFGMSLGELAMGFVRSRWFVTSVSVRGADCDELSSALASLYNAEVTADVLGELEAAALRLTLDEERVGRRRWSQEL